MRLSDDSSGNGRDTSIASGVSTGSTASLKNASSDDALRLVQFGGREEPDSLARPAPATARRSPADTARCTNACARSPMAASCWLGVSPARSGEVSPSATACLQAGDADHEELVEVRRRDGGELDALEQRHRRVGGFLEHALVERQPRQLAVDEAGCASCVRARRVTRSPPPVGRPAAGRTLRRTCPRVPSRPSAPS